MVILNLKKKGFISNKNSSRVKIANYGFKFNLKKEESISRDSAIVKVIKRETIEEITNFLNFSDINQKNFDLEEMKRNDYRLNCN